MINWEAIKAEYGVKSNRALAVEYGCAESSIRKQADKEKWKKAKVRTKKVRTAKVRTDTEVRTTQPATKGKAGNTTIKTPELIERLMDLISDGCSARSACMKIGIAQRSLWNWLAQDPQLMQQYARAKDQCGHNLAEEIIEIADDSSRDWLTDENGRETIDHEAINRARLRVDARKWYAAKLVPKKYGERQTIQGDDDKPIQHHIRVSFVSGNGEKVINPPKVFQIGSGGRD